MGVLIGWIYPSDITEDSPTIDYADKRGPIQWPAILTHGTAPIGAVLAVILMNFIGRTRAMLFMCGGMFVSWLIMGLTNMDTWIVYMQRVSIAIFSGSFLVLAPVYIAEIAESNIRGALGGFFYLLYLFGMLYIWALENLVSLGSLAFLISFPIIYMFVAIHYLPETPWWLIANRKSFTVLQEAYAKLRGTRYVFDEEFWFIDEALTEAAAQNRRGFRSTVRNIEFRKAMIQMTIIIMAEQLCGLTAVFGFIFRIQSITRSKALGMISCCIVAASIAITLVDRIGRRILLVSSFLSMSVFLIVLASYCQYYGNSFEILEHFTTYALATSYMTCYSFGAGPIPWIMVGEMFAPEMKSFGCAYCAILHWACACVVRGSYYRLFALLRYSVVFWIYAGISLMFCFLIYFAILETKRKTLEMIQAQLGRVNHTRAPSYSFRIMDPDMDGMSFFFKPRYFDLRKSIE